jgi:hypothetical protein
MKMGIHQTLIDHRIQPFWIPTFAGMTVRHVVLALRVTAISPLKNPTIMFARCIPAGEHDGWVLRLFNQI